MSSAQYRKFAVVGGGAMGSVFAAYLAEAGHPTTIVDVDHALVDQVGRHGLHIRQGDTERSVAVHATTRPGEVGPVDAVLFFVKCHQTRAAADLARPLLGPSTSVVTLQNGWGNADVLAPVFGSDRLVIGVTYTSATVVAPGTVSTPGPGVTVVGSYNGDRADAATAVAKALSGAGFDVRQPERIRDEIWKKLVLNAATLPTAALTGLTAGALGQPGEMLDLVRAATAEAVAVGSAHGFEVDFDERVAAIEQILAGAGDGKGSMLQDIEAGRRTEIDVISGAVVRMAQEHRVHVPVTKALYALIAGLERARGQR